MFRKLLKSSFATRKRYCLLAKKQEFHPKSKSIEAQAAPAIKKYLKPMTCMLLAGIWVLNHHSLRDPLVLQARELNSKDSSKRAGLFFEACKEANIAELKEILADGHNVNSSHKFGWTGLMVAAVNGHTDVVQLLLESGANPNLQDEYDPFDHSREGLSPYSYRDFWNVRRDEFSPVFDDTSPCVGWTALHYAAVLDQTDIICLLYDYGADGTMENRNGTMAKSLASSSTRELMSQYEAEQNNRRCSDVFRKVRLKEMLSCSLVGQTVAVEEVCGVISRLENGWTNEKHPLVLLFLGASGLGKTEMAKLLASYLRGGEKDSFLHINLSEYGTEHEAAKFTGAPPGYVGYGNAGEGQLITILKKNPQAIVLFDEADKAHPNVLATLLQLFDEGRLTSGTGTTVECSEALFILTANLGLEEIDKFAQELRKRYELADESEDNSNNAPLIPRHEFIQGFKELLLHGPLKAAFRRDELIGRINETAVFIPFSLTERHRVIELGLQRVGRTAAAKHGITLSWQQSVVKMLDKGFNDKYGARSVKYEIDRCIVTKLCKAQEAGLYKAGDFLHLEVNDRLGASVEGQDKPNESDRVIQLYKLSPSGNTELLDSWFEDLSDLLKISTC